MSHVIRGDGFVIHLFFGGRLGRFNRQIRLTSSFEKIWLGSERRRSVVEERWMDRRTGGNEVAK